MSWDGGSLGVAVAQSVRDWAEKQWVLGSRPNTDNSCEGIPAAGGGTCNTLGQAPNPAMS